MNGSRAAEDVYDVERILDDRMYKGRKQYLIKWMGYPDSESTWEFKSNLFCEELLQEYEKNKRLQIKGSDKMASKSVPVNAEKETTVPRGKRSHEGVIRPQERIVSVEADSGLIKVHVPEKQSKFEQVITNEWHEAVEKVTGAYINEHGVLEIEFVTVNGIAATCSSDEMRYKAPLKLLDFYEENLDFPE